MYFETFIKWLIPFLCGGAVSALGVIIGRIKLAFPLRLLEANHI